MLQKVVRALKSIVPGRAQYEQIAEASADQQNARPTSSGNHPDIILTGLQSIPNRLSQMSDFARQTEMNATQLIAQSISLNERIKTELNLIIQQLQKAHQEVSRHLNSIGLTTSSMLVELATTKSELDQLLGNIQSNNSAQLHFKRQLLQELLSLIIKHRSFGTIFGKVAFLIELELKLRAAFSMFEIVHPSNDITNSHPQLYASVYKHITILQPPNPAEIQQNYRTMTKIFHILAGAMVRTMNYQSNFLKKMVLGWNIVLNGLINDRGLLHSLSFYRHPTLGPVAQFYNLFEDGFLGMLTGLGFQKIRTNSFIYIPIKPHNQDVDIFSKQQNSIPVRVLYHQQLSKLKKSKKNEEQLENIIIHVHGGGYAVHSSRSSQGFTRKWANQLGVPIFSIDYRKAPQVTHPLSAYDCLQAYRFIVDHLPTYMRIKPTNIYLAGDASGGSIVCSLMALILKERLILPKGIFLAYPGLDFRPIYYPSRRFIFNDPMIWPTVAQVFVDAYFPKPEQKNDPLASPILLTEQFVGGQKGDKRFPLNWPRTYLMVGDKDLVRDECLLLMQRMQQSRVPFKCWLYKELGHGFLVTQGLIKYSSTTVMDSIELWRELLHSDYNKAMN